MPTGSYLFYNIIDANETANVCGLLFVKKNKMLLTIFILLRVSICFTLLILMK